MQIYDVKKCFDTMWFKKAMNDLYDSSMTDDKFSLLCETNKKANIAVKVPGSGLKGWFTKNASWVHMKEFSELIRMVYATYSNSSPIVRNLKIKN